MTSADLEAAVADLMAVDRQEMRVTLPKLKLEFDLEVKEVLEEVFEVKSLFSSAQLKPGFGPEKDPKVTLALQKSVFELLSDPKAKGGEGEPPKTLNVNRPFLFLLRENTSGAVVVFGKVNHLVDEEALGLGFI